MRKKLSGLSDSTVEGRALRDEWGAWDLSWGQVPSSPILLFCSLVFSASWAGDRFPPPPTLFCSVLKCSLLVESSLDSSPQPSDLPRLFLNEMIWEGGGTESEKTRQRISNADRKVFANPESFCKFIIDWRISGYFAIQNIQIICKVSRWTGKFPDNLKSVRII